MSTLNWKIECVAPLSFRWNALICQCRAIFWPSKLFGGTFLTFEGRLLKRKHNFNIKAEKNDKIAQTKGKKRFLALL